VIAFHDRVREHLVARLDEALRLHREAIGLLPDGHPKCADVLANLAFAFEQCAAITGDRTPCEDAVKIRHEAVAFLSPEHFLHVGSLKKLGFAVLELGQATKDMVIIDEAIALHHQTIEHCSAEHPERPTSLASVVVVFWGHAARTNEATDKAERLPRAAGRRCGAGRAVRHAFANVLWRPYRTPSSARALDEAVAMHKAAPRRRRRSMRPVHACEGHRGDGQEAQAPRHDRLAPAPDMGVTAGCIGRCERQAGATLIGAAGIAAGDAMPDRGQYDIRWRRRTAVMFGFGLSRQRCCCLTLSRCEVTDWRW
jgi:hypothetical protein